MRGVKDKYLTAIMNFLYHGKVTIFQEDMNDFLEIAEELDLKGLTKGGISDQNNPI